jgi:membrane protease YdiL (CAAX protease family)
MYSTHDLFSLANGQGLPDLTIFVLAAAVFPVLSIYRGKRIADSPTASLAPKYIGMIARGLAMAALTLGVWRICGRPWETLGLGIPLSAAGRYGLAFAGLLGLAAAMPIVFIDRFAKPERLARLRAQMRRIRILPGSDVEFMLFAVVALVAGFWEELLYRGFLIWFLTPYASAAGAIYLSSAAFAIGHLYQGWRSIPRTGAIGLIFAAAYVLSGSLWWLMALHALVDLFGGCLAWRLTRRSAAAVATVA